MFSRSFFMQKFNHKEMKAMLKDEILEKIFGYDESSDFDDDTDFVFKCKMLELF